MPLMPLLIHFVFHPHSDAARWIAHHLHGALNGDPLLPGLRVPTTMLPERDNARPPASIDLSESERAIIVVLADDHLEADDPPAAAGPSWSSFVGDLPAACQGDRQRIVPVQLSLNAWPLDDRLSSLSFLRAYLQDPLDRPAWLARQIVIEIGRFLYKRSPSGPAPVRLFVSHSKRDIAEEPKIFEAIARYLDSKQPVESWIDSAKIASGADFAAEIRSGVQSSAMLVLLTESYSARPWCRREVLIAKEYGRPIVVVDALQGVDARSFPYIGNVPVMSWRADGAAHAVDLLLREFVRIEHTQLVLQAQAQPGDEVMSSPPELLTLARMHAAGKHILYPDPPLSDEEASMLDLLRMDVSTPLQRAGQRRLLAGLRIALSISESDDIARRGLQPIQLDEVARELARHLLARGAVLVYGGHLDDKSYTRDLAELVAAYHSVDTMPSVERIVNYVGWPLPYEKLPIEKRAALKRLLTFERVSRPDGVEELDPETFVDEPEFFPADTSERRYAWARGMSAMRERQSRETYARIAIGGKVGPAVGAADEGDPKSWYTSRIPGVVEEILESIKAGRPLYICGAFGGAAGLAAELLQGREPTAFTWDYQRRAPYSEEMRALYEKRAEAWEDYPHMRAALISYGVAGLARANGLTEDENRELFISRNPLRIVELLLSGIAKVSSPAPAAPPT